MPLLKVITLSFISSDNTVKFSSYHSLLSLSVSYLESTSSFSISCCLGLKELKTLSITAIPSSVTLPLESLKTSKVTA